MLIRNDTAPLSLGRISTLIAAALLVAMAIPLFILAQKQSPDYDEHVMVSAGLSYVQRGDARMNWEHPPLTKLLGGWGALMTGVAAPYDSDSWRYERQYDFGGELYTHADPSIRQRLVFYPRVPMVLMSLALGLVIYLWVKSVSGDLAGLVALALYCTCPLMLGWGMFVLNDVAVALFSVLACWAAVATWRKPSPGRWIVLGASFGLALMAKFSAVALLPVVGLLFIILGWQQRHELSRARLKQLSVAIVGAMLVAGAVVWVTYLYAYRQMPPDQFIGVWQERAMAMGTQRTPAQQQMMQRMKAELASHPVVERAIAPGFYLATGVYTIAINTDRPAWILGKYYPVGQWFYFPVVMLFKSPPGMLLILLAGFVVFAVRWRRWVRNPDVLAMSLLFVIFTAAYTRSRTNIGIRYYVCSVAIAIAIASVALVPEVTALSSRGRKIAGAFVGIALAQCAVAAILTYPFYIPYYNVLRGHHEREYISSDANVDHGTYLPWILQFERDHGGANVSLVDFSLSAPAWVPQATHWECEGPVAPTRWVIVSAAFLEAAKKKLPCAWLRQYPAQELAGGSMWAFDLQQANATQGDILQRSAGGKR